MTAQDLPGGTEKTVALVDLGKGYPFDGDGKATMYVPRVKITRDGSKKVTGIDLAFYRWDATAGEYVPARAESVARLLTRPPQFTMEDFSPPTGQDISLTFTLYPVEGSENSLYSLGSQTIADDWRAGMDNNPGIVNAYWNIEAVAVNFEAYGTNYRFKFRDDGIY